MVVGVWTVNTKIKSPVFSDRNVTWSASNPINMLIGSTFSVVAYKSIQNFPSAEPRLVTSDNVISIGGCAAL